MNIGIVYWIGGIAQTLGAVCLVIGIVLGILLGFVALFSMAEGTYFIKEYARQLKICVIAVPILIMAGVVIPNRREVVAMYIVPKIAANEKIQLISEKALARIERILDCDLSKNGRGFEKEEAL